MTRWILLFVLAALAGFAVLVSGPLAKDAVPRQTLSLGAVAQVVGTRYDGEILGIRADDPRSHERRAGAALIYEVTWLTPQEAVIRVRIDAVTGQFLTIEGAGQVAARRRK